MDISNVRKLTEEIGYYGERPETLLRIAQTIAALPDDVAIFALRQMVFASVGAGVMGMTLPGRIGLAGGSRAFKNRWIVILDDAMPDNEFPTTIAHEIAHAWLKHDRLGEMPPNCEREAAEQARSWGFKGLGADPAFCRQHDSIAEGD